MAQDSIITRAQQVLFPNYARFPLAVTAGEGLRITAADGRRYLDFTGGVAVTCLGHTHAATTAAIRHQAGQLLHASNLFYTEPQVALAEALVGASFADRVFFCNSGAEANEAAIKMARRAMGPDRYEIITTNGSFHGRTLTTVSATGQDKVKVGFDPLPPGFVHVPYDDPAAAAAAVTSRTAAILVEPVQGEGGVRVPAPDYLQALRTLCDREGILLILDEVQTGAGRLGTLFGYQLAGIVPDAITLAKGMGNGLPIGALLAREDLAQTLGPGSHGSTFGGGPLVCAGALEVIRELTQDDQILANARTMGERLRQGLTALQSRFPVIEEVRGLGMLWGVSLTVPAAPLLTACREQGLLVLPAGEQVMRLAPALNLTTEDVDEALGYIEAALAATTTAMAAEHNQA